MYFNYLQFYFEWYSHTQDWFDRRVTAAQDWLLINIKVLMKALFLIRLLILNLHRPGYFGGMAFVYFLFALSLPSIYFTTTVLLCVDSTLFNQAFRVVFFVYSFEIP